MAIFHNGYENIKVTLINCAGNDLAKRVYEFGRLSHDFDRVLPHFYNEHNDDCKALIEKIIEGTTLPKFALQGTRLEFRIENISRICLAQLTRDSAIFASQGGGILPLSQDINVPMSIYNDNDLMDKLKLAQSILESAYIDAIEKGIPNLEARYIGLHSQTISLTASYTVSDFVRSCYSRTSSNFCDECNYVYRLMFYALKNYIVNEVTDNLSIALWEWLIPEAKCINDGFYSRERLFNSDFTVSLKNFYEYQHYVKKTALFDWRKSGWKMELERMAEEQPWLLTSKEHELIKEWKENADNLISTHDSSAPDVCENLIKKMHYYNKEGNN